MAVSYFVLYRGSATDPAAFLERYRSVHVPILQTWPGIERIELHSAIPWVDPERVHPAGLALVAQMQFESADALQQALRSAQRGIARRDFHDFPPFRGEVLHQAMRSEQLR
jgi:uncharacterized protein (TIGR02118 family)